jgi:DNA helicase-2/ATP-dependent DNA helicase PcrA
MDRDQQENADAVSIMTLHSAKGLEFDTVFLPGWEEGLFPHQRSLDDQGRAGLEEERRLAHVGLTRARRRAKLYFATNRRIHGMWTSTIPSRFLDELPEAHVEVTESMGSFGAQNFGASRFDTFGPASSNYTTPGWKRAQQRQARMDRGRVDDDGFADEGFDYDAHERKRFRDADAAIDDAPPARNFFAPDDDPASGKRAPSHSAKGTGTAKGRFAARREPLTIEGELVAKSTGTVSAYTVGDRVFHTKFGNGNVTAIEGNKLTIQFDRAGEKRVVDSFVERVL